MLSLHTGYDTAYLTDAVGASDYYTGAGGEPPGYWQGAGATALGLAGQVDAKVMRDLYHDDVGPDGQVLARHQRPGKYPAAAGSLHKRIEAEVADQVAAADGIITPEEIREIRLRLRAQWRNRVPFYDYTFSVPKSLTVVWASLLQAAAEAAAEHREADAEQLTERAEQLRAAVKRANDRMIALAEQRLAYVRTGHHSSTSGQWRDAAGFIVASFPQHTNREGDPQLHVHNAIANRAQRADGADDKWRALHGHPLFKEKLGLGAYGERFLEQEVNRLGWRTVRRADGNTFEIGGISEEAADVYSYRSREVADRYRELEAQYVSDHGRAPDKRARWALKQRAALETRDAKEHNPPPHGRELETWARKAERSGAGKLSSLHWRAQIYAAEHEPSELPSAAERARAIRIAIAEVQRQNAVWNRSQLVFELGRALPSLPPDVDPRAYLDELADEALSGRAEGATVIQVAPVPDVVDVTRLGVRKDGTSIYRPPGEELFVTSEHLDHEQYLLDIATLPLPQRVTAEAAAAALAGTDLNYSQREACLGLLTSGRLINCLEAPAGTGKTHVMAAFARVWEEQRAGRVIGLAASTNAARVMADEAAKAGARMETYNIAQFLGKIKGSTETRGHVPIYPGDVLVIDEATQVSTEDALRIVQAARRCGAMVISTGDPEQLGAVDAGGIFRLIAARHGSYRLTEVRRFTHAWERDASLRLREGDVSVLAEYEARGRIYHGPQDRVFDDAVSLYLNGYLNGSDVLLMATSNETAARLAALVRERLIELGQVSSEAEITLADGNQAGRGDLLRARLNTRIDADGQSLANRDVIRVKSFNDSGFGRLAVAVRQTGPDQWSRPFFVPVAYLESDAELAYAGNVHVAQGATVDRAHTVIDAGAIRSLVYTGGTRGREKNTFHVVTGAADPAQPGRPEREAYADAQIRRAAALREAGESDLAREVRLTMPDRPSDRQLAPWEAILAQALQQDEPEQTALEAMQAAQDWTTNGGHLFQLRQAFWWKDVAPQIDEAIRQRLSPRDYERYLQDPERPALLQALRTHEIGGRSIEDSLDAITAASFVGLRSIAAGLHGRLGKQPPPVRGETKTWTERTPAQASAEIREADLLADRRQAELGRRALLWAPPWAVRAWGRPPAEPGALREDWKQRAGLVSYYREITGITDPEQAIGPAPSGQADLAELFRASVRALQLPDEAALLKAMNRGELEARVQGYLRATAVAPVDVQADVGDREHMAEEARTRAEAAIAAGDVTAAEAAEAEARQHTEDLARLAVADAARREWREATAVQEAAAREAAAELRRRGIEERIPVTDAEVAAAEATERETPSTPTIDPADYARWKADQTAQVEADRQARAEAAARRTPVTDAELARYGAQQPEPEAEAEADSERSLEREQRAADLAKIREKTEAVEEAVRQTPDREAERVAEMDEAAINEPVSHGPQAEPELEPSWQRGEADAETWAAAPGSAAGIEDVEAELEI